MQLLIVFAITSECLFIQNSQIAPRKLIVYSYFLNSFLKIICIIKIYLSVISIPIFLKMEIVLIELGHKLYLDTGLH